MNQDGRRAASAAGVGAAFELRAGVYAVPPGRFKLAGLRQLYELNLVCVVCFDADRLLAVIRRRDTDFVVVHVGITADPARLIERIRNLTASPVLLMARTPRGRHGADAVLVEERPLAMQIAASLPHLANGATSGDADRSATAGLDRITEVRCGGLTLDSWRRRATWRGQELNLTTQQFHLLWRLCQADGGLVTVEQLSASLYGDRVGADRQRVVAHIRRIRRMLEKDSAHPVFLVTVRGEGFRLTDEA